MKQIAIEQLKLANVAGIIQAKDLLKFTRMVFRITKGNSILYTFDIPKEKDPIIKQCREIMLFFDRESSEINLLSVFSFSYLKLTRTCLSFANCGSIKQ